MCALNFGISVWNANSVGKVWTESKYIGGGIRVLAVCGYIMAVAGFTMVYTIIILAIIGATQGFGYLDAEQAAVLLQIIGDLSYILIACAIIPTGIIITINSVVSFWRRKTLRGGLLAGWNTFATVSNVVSAARTMPSAFGRLLNTARNNRNGGIVLLAIIVVALCVLGGYFTTSAIVKRADKKYDLFNNVAPGYAAAAAGGGAGAGGYGPGTQGQGQAQGYQQSGWQPQGYPEDAGQAQGYPQGAGPQNQRDMAAREAELRNRSGQ
jgi:hypothetical protein